MAGNNNAQNTVDNSMVLTIMQRRVRSRVQHEAAPRHLPPVPFQNAALRCNLDPSPPLSPGTASAKLDGETGKLRFKNAAGALAEATKRDTVAPSTSSDSSPEAAGVGFTGKHEPVAGGVYPQLLHIRRSHKLCDIITAWPMLESTMSGTMTVPELLVLTCTSTVQCLPSGAIRRGTTVLLMLGQGIACTMLKKTGTKSHSGGDIRCAARSWAQTREEGGRRRRGREQS
jgi:hypothetical protein